MFTPRTLVATALALAAAFLLAGCAGSSPSPTVSSSSDPEFAAKVAEELDAAKAPQLTPPVSGGAAAVPGKSIAIVTITMAEAAALRVTNALAEAARAIGWEETVYDGQGSATTANSRLVQAVTTNPDAIVLVALDANAVGSGMAAAQNAGIPVACAACWDTSASDGEFKGSYATVQPAFSQLIAMGRLSAEYAYQQTDGHPHYLKMNDPALSNLAGRGEGFDEFLAECQDAGGDCSLVGDSPFQVANVTTTLAAQAASEAQANPEFNALWVGFDFAALSAMNGMTQAGLIPTDSSFLTSSNGDGQNLEIIAEGGYQKATVAIAWEWASYAVIDDLNQLFAGEDPLGQLVPIRLFDVSNASEADEGNWAGDVDFAAAFRESWGL